MVQCAVSPRACLVAVAAAALCALAPIPPATVERLYSNRLYLAIQGWVTPASNRVPVALLDIAAGCLLLAACVALRSRVRRVGPRRTAVSAAWTLVGGSAIVYLLFLALWGLNYRRVPLEQKLDYDASRLTRERAMAFTNTAVAEVNARYGGAHGAPLDYSRFQQSFAEAQRALGAHRTAATGVPKRSLLTFYFRRAAIDGMTDPLFLEIIINRDVLDFEWPFVVAHEWAHLAGYANEAEANFVAWMTCVGGDDLARYSGWLAAYQHAFGALSRADRRAIAKLDGGPLADLRAMSARYARSSPAVREAARGVYDEYLRANRVAEGIGSYDAVVRLLIGARFDDSWRPARR